jgi:hypothetical protein
MMQNFDDQSPNPGTLLHREWAKESIVYSMRYDEESGSVPESQRLACQLRQPAAILLLPKPSFPQMSGHTPNLAAMLSSDD